MIFVLFLVTSIVVQPDYYTNTNYFYEITSNDTLIFGATNGGMVVYDYQQDSFTVLTNTDGLPTNRQLSIDLDSSGYVWVGSEKGLSLVTSDSEEILVYPIEYLAGMRTQEIVCRRDSVYVGSSTGLLFIDTRGTPTNVDDDVRVRRLPNENIISLAVDDTLIWVGTTSGLYTFTKDFSVSQQYDIFNGLLGNSIRTIFIHDTLVYVAADSGLNVYHNGGFDTLPGLAQHHIGDIVRVGDSLALALDSISQFGFYYQNILQIVKTGLPTQCKVRSLLVLNSVLFCGLGNRYTRDYYGEGVGRYDFSGQRWNIIKRRCLPSNHIAHITTNEQGVFVACGSRGGDSRGFGWLKNDGTWLSFSRDSLLPNNQIHRCVTAPDGKVWFGINTFSCSGGDTIMMFSFDPATDDWNFIRYGYNDIDSTVAVWDIEFDRNNNMYLALAGPSDKLWLLDSTLTTALFLGERSPGFKVEIALDSTDKIWTTVTGAEGGLTMIDTRHTLFDRGDDVVLKYGESDGLLSRSASGCVVDKNNNLWVADEIGIVLYDGTRFLGITTISDDDYIDVALDSEGRVWVMARDGIYYYDPILAITDGVNFSEHGIDIEFMAFSDEFIQVQGFAFDSLPGRQCFWIGGETGLLQLKVYYDTLPGLDSIVVYPNPAVNQNSIRIKHIPVDSRVDIYSLSGRLIERDLSIDNVFGEVVWELPEDIGSGLYFALVKSERGTRVCKFAIVR